MSDVPSWLTEENVQTAATVAKHVDNPVAKAVVASRIPPPPPPPPPSKSSATRNDIEAAVASPVANASPTAPSEFIIDEETLKKMQQWHLALRVLYCGAAIFMSASAALSLQNQSDIGLAFFAFYVFVFSAMICCFEVALNSIARILAVNFGFMYMWQGRSTFLLFVGFMVYGLSLMGKFAMGVLYGVGLLNLYVVYQFPRFEEYLRKKHYYEGKNVK